MFAGATWEPIDAGARGEGLTRDFEPTPSVKPMDAQAERETDITTRCELAAREGGPGRRTVGVGEGVMLRSPSNGTWTASAVGTGGLATAKGGSYRWVAPDRAGQVTITLASGKGQPQTVTFEVIEPQDVEFSWLAEATAADLENNPIGGGMYTKLDFLPATVSFQAASWSEVGGGPSNPTGLFLSEPAPQHKPSKKPIAMDRAADLAAYFQRTLPRAGGSFDWLIPNQFQVGGGAPKQFVTTVQHIKLADPPMEGYVTVSKRGAATGQINSTTRGPKGVEVPRQVTKDESGAKGDGMQEQHVSGHVKNGAPPDASTTKESQQGPWPAPPEFAALAADTTLVDLLYRSQDPNHLLAGDPREPFWDRMKKLSAAQLRTLVHTIGGARNAGVFPKISKLKAVYTYGSSWGIEFYSTDNVVGITAKGWGKDWPQDVVRAEHGGTAHDWYRQDSGAGHAGMHLGVDAGAGFHNIHWDPTNPMERVSDGKIQGSPYVAKMPTLMDLIPAGMAIYSARETLEHALEIGAIKGKKAEMLKKLGFGKPRTPEITSEPFLSITIVYNEHVRPMNEYADREAARVADVKDTGRSAAAIARMHAAAKDFEKFYETTKPIAMKDHGADKAPVDEVTKRFEAQKHAMFGAFASYFAHLEQELTAVPDKGKGLAAEAAWAVQMPWGKVWDTFAALAEARVKEKTAKP